jgi:Leucine-rich repeat (LRR) protein
MSAQNPLTIASNRAFEEAVETMVGHDRLRDAIRAAIRSAKGSQEKELIGGEDKHHRELLEGIAAPEERLVTYTKIRNELRDEFPHPILFNFCNFQLGISGAKELSRLITPPLRPPMITTGLVYLDLSDNTVTDLGQNFDILRNICYQLARCTSLRFLSLHNTTLLDKGAGVVSRLLRNTNALRVLDLSRCNLGDKGANALFAAFCREDEFDPALLELEVARLEEEDAPLVPAQVVATDQAVAAELPPPVIPVPAAPAVPVATAAAETVPPVPALTVPAAGPIKPASSNNLGFTFGSGMPDRPTSAGHSARDQPKSGLRSKVAASAATAGATAVPPIVSPTALASIEAPNTSLEWLDLSNNNLGGMDHCWPLTNMLGMSAA